MLDTSTLEQRVAEKMAADKIPGLALTVVHQAQVVYAQGFGLTSVAENGLPVTPDTVFRIGSITKPLTGTAIMRLAEAGRLALDRPVAEYLPWFRLPDAAAAARITLRMLLTHTSGLPTIGVPFGSRDPEGLERHVRDEISQSQLVAPPGKLFSYSNPGFNLAGCAAQAVSGKWYHELMAEQVFVPLGMERTTFDPLVAMTYPLALPHSAEPDGTLRADRRFFDNVAHYPSGFAMTTAADLARFAIMQMSEGGAVLAPGSVRQMQTRQVRTYGLDDGGYGLAFFVSRHRGRRRVYHSGGIGSYDCMLDMLPDEGAAVILLANRWVMSTLAFTGSILDLLLGGEGKLPGPQPAAVNRGLWSLYTGTFGHPWRGVCTVKAEGEQLTAVANGEPVALQGIGDDLYCGRQGEGQMTVGFVPEADQPVQYIVVNSTPMRRLELHDSFTPDPATWAAYTGVYTEPDWSFPITVRQKGEHLWFQAGTDPEHRCVPLGPDRFACAAGYIAFRRAPDGAVDGLTWGERTFCPRKPG